MHWLHRKVYRRDNWYAVARGNLGTIIFFALLVALLVGIPFYYKVWELKESEKETEKAISLMARLLYDNEEELSQWKTTLRKYDNPINLWNEHSPTYMKGYRGSAQDLKLQMKIMRRTVERVEIAEERGVFPPRGYPKIIEPNE